jgi:cyclopropane fatty-acyl-phospholipid synthase-like methyltransferase
MSSSLVKKGYNQIASNYLKNRDRFESISYLRRLTKYLKPGAKILDLGCGAGLPVDKFLIDKGFDVIGVDISEEQIRLAKENVPLGKFEVKDIKKLKFKEYEVDVVVSFYTIFHIKRKRHKLLFKKIASFLPKGGMLLVSMGASDWEGIDSFYGVRMFWSHYSQKTNREIIKDAGFEIIFDKIDKSGGEKHQVILATSI